MGWGKLLLNDCNKKSRIKHEKDKLIRFSDHDDMDESIINLLMELEINEDDREYNENLLLRRISKLEEVIEVIIDNYEVDLRDFSVDDDIWMEATKQRRREKRMGKLLD